MFNTAPYEWVVTHLSVIGWPAVFYAVYRIVIVCFRIGRAATLIEQRVLKGEETLHLVATNHIPHLQLELEKSNDVLVDIREELKISRLTRGTAGA